MGNLFEDVKKQLIKESKQCLPLLQKIIKNSDHYYKRMNLISKPVLMLLLEQAVEKIAVLENEMYYEIDVMDALCEREFVFEDLVKRSVEHCELWTQEDDNER